jgi:hypothetical protein
MLSDEVWKQGVALASSGAQSSSTFNNSKPIQSPDAPTANPTLGDYLLDVPRGVGAGAVGFVQSLGRFADDVSNVFGADLIDDEGSFYKPVVKTRTFVGDITKGLTQFAMAFIPFAGIAGRIGTALNVGKLGAAALHAGAGAAADFVAFDQTQSRLSDLIQEFPTLQNPITDYLSHKEDDSFVEARLKNTFEGLGLGAVTGVALKALKGFKGAVIAKAAGDTKSLLQHLSDTGSAVAEAVGKTGDDLKAPIAPLPTSTVVAPVKADVTQLLKEPVLDKLKSSFVEEVKKGTDRGLPFMDAVGDSFKTHINLDTLNAGTEIEITMRSLTSVMDDVIQKGVSGSQSLELLKNHADNIVSIYGKKADGLRQILIDSAADASAVTGLTARSLAYDMTRNQLAGKVRDLAGQWFSAFQAGGEVSKELTQSLLDKSGALMNLHYNAQLIQTNTARVTSAGRIMLGLPDIDVEGMVKGIEKTLKGADKKTSAEELVKTIMAAGDDSKALTNIFNFYEKSTSKALSIHNEFWINALLSGLKTQAANVVNQLSTTLLMPADRIIGGLVSGDAKAMKSGARLYMGMVKQGLDLFGLINASGYSTENTAVGLGWKSLLHESPIVDGLTSSESGKAITAGAFGLTPESLIGQAVDYAGKAVRLPSRLLTGVDTAMKVFNARAYLFDEAMRVAEEKAIPSDKLGQFVADHILGAFDKASGAITNEGALAYGQRAVSASPLKPGTWGGDFSKFVNSHPAMKMIVPFVRTPTNIFKTMREYTPGVNFLFKEFRDKWVSSDPLVRADARGRFALGGLFWTTAAGLSLAGKITGGGPSDKEQRDSLMATGWRPYSVVTQNDDGSKEYISFNRLEPLGAILGMVGDYVDINRHLSDEDAYGVAQAMTVSLAHNLTNKSYLSGISQFIGVLSQPDQQARKFIENRLASYVPNLFGQATGDDYLRDTRTILDAVMRKVPGYSESLPPRRNVFGEAVPVPQGWLPFGGEGTSVARMVSPVGYSKSVSDPVKDELARLQYGFNLPAQKYQGADLTKFQNEKGQDAYDRLQELHGQVTLGGKTLPQAIEHLIDSGHYKTLPYPEKDRDSTNPRVRAIVDVISDYRQAAMQHTLKEYPQIGKTVKEARLRSSLGISPLLQLTK